MESFLGQKKDFCRFHETPQLNARYRNAVIFLCDFQLLTTLVILQLLQPINCKVYLGSNKCDYSKLKQLYSISTYNPTLDLSNTNSKNLLNQTAQQRSGWAQQMCSNFPSVS
jgi:hypothetical protein